MKLMLEVIFRDKGRNYQVPGLPYDQTYQFIEPVVIQGVPTPQDLEQLLKQGDSSTLIAPWSMPVIRGFRDYIPTTFRRVTQNMPTELFEEYFGLSSNWIPEPERVLLQLQTEIEAKGATIDAAIIHARKDRGLLWG